MSLESVKLPKEAESLNDLQKQILRAFIYLGVGEPVTQDQIKKAMGLDDGEHQQLRRRFTELRERGWNARRVGQEGKIHFYALESAKPTLTTKADRAISYKDRAAVLHKSGSRCEMCGASAKDDG
ncbi:MAG: hypothetical protein KIT88_05075, partial [Phycisphaeraceae bacterium]|nr:hypothetical protein [Phycisphaeraceae bacterium]